MPTRDEMASHAAIQRSGRELGRIADALERIARVLEQREFGLTSEDVRAAKADLEADARIGR